MSERDKAMSKKEARYSLDDMKAFDAFMESPCYVCKQPNYDCICEGS